MVKENLLNRGKITTVPVLLLFVLWSCGDVGDNATQIGQGNHVQVEKIRITGLTPAQIKATGLTPAWEKVDLDEIPAKMRAGVRVFEGQEPDGFDGFKQRVVLDANNEKVKKLLETDVPKNDETPLDGWLKNSSVSFAFLQGSDLKRIGREVLANLFLEEVDIPYGITEIGEGAFAGNDLKTLELPGTLETIGERAFGRNKLKNLVIPKSVKKIDKGAFLHNDLETVVLTQEQLNQTAPDTFLIRGQGTAKVDPKFIDHSGVQIFRQP